jgi:hypothetical protein
MTTAVEWFIINLIQVCGAPPEGTWKEVENLLQQAKEMEREQIIYSNYNGQSVGKKLKDINIHQMKTKAEEYYNETFKSE